MPGKQQAFSIDELEEVFKTHYVALSRTAYRLLNDTMNAEDIVQDVFCKLWEKKEMLGDITSLKSYLFKAVINAALNQLKKENTIQTREAEYSYHGPTNSDSLHEQLNYKDTQKRVTEAINTLPPTCRLVFVLSRFEQLSYKEIAANLGISVKAVENHVMKALKHLRNVVGIIMFLLFFYNR